MKHTAKLIKDRRIELGLSQGQVAKKIKCNIQQVSQWERGAFPIPIKMAKRLAKFFNIQGRTMRDCIRADFSKRLGEKWEKAK